jgi:drug/metabolite transporter (DMT)-like permease
VPFSYERGFSPPTVVFARYVILLACLAVLLPVMGLRYQLPRVPAFHAFGSGIAAALGALSLLVSFAYIPISLAIVILYTFPILTALLESARARKLPSASEVLCLVTALAGIGIAIGLDQMSLSAVGIALATLSAIAYSISIFWNSTRLRNTDATLVTFYMAVAGVAASALYVAATGTLALPQSGPGAWFPLAITCVLFTVAFLGMFKAVEFAGGAPTAMVLNLEPVFAIILAIPILGETLTLPRLLGSALVIGAVVVSELSRNRRKVAVELAG